ncbi:AAA family ATPase [Candidatus Saccharibacteria bacterium]|nr:AAA family ATPase [Candidatus Saccharibacteria bacterium]
MSTSAKFPKVIAVVGMMGSGKGTAVEYLTKKYSWPSVYFGGMVYEEVARRGLDIVRDETAVRQDMRAKEGPAVLAKRVAVKAHELLNEGAETVVLDGLYSWSEDKYLRQEFGNDIIMIAVVAPKKLRRQRVLERVDQRRKYTLDEVVEREIAEIENIEKGGPIAYADFYVMNDEGMKNLHRQLDRIVKDLKKS